jgi:hypothetical protein
MAGLPSNSACVSVDPSLSCNGPSRNTRQRSGPRGSADPGRVTSRGCEYLGTQDGYLARSPRLYTYSGLCYLYLHVWR